MFGLGRTLQVIRGNLLAPASGLARISHTGCACAALRATKDKLQIGTEPAPQLVAKLNDAHPATGTVVDHLKKQGMQSLDLDQALKACDAVSKPPAQPAQPR